MIFFLKKKKIQHLNDAQQVNSFPEVRVWVKSYMMFVHLKVIIKIKEAVINVPREGVEREFNITD